MSLPFLPTGTECRTCQPCLRNFSSFVPTVSSPPAPTRQARSSVFISMARAMKVPTFERSFMAASWASACSRASCPGRWSEMSRQAGARGGSCRLGWTTRAVSAVVISWATSGARAPACDWASNAATAASNSARWASTSTVAAPDCRSTQPIRWPVWSLTYNRSLPYRRQRSTRSPRSVTR